MKMQYLVKSGIYETLLPISHKNERTRKASYIVLQIFYFNSLFTNKD